MADRGGDPFDIHKILQALRYLKIYTTEDPDWIQNDRIQAGTRYWSRTVKNDPPLDDETLDRFAHRFVPFVSLLASSHSSGRVYVLCRTRRVRGSIAKGWRSRAGVLFCPLHTPLP